MLCAKYLAIGKTVCAQMVCYFSDINPKIMNKKDLLFWNFRWRRYRGGIAKQPCLSEYFFQTGMVSAVYTATDALMCGWGS